MGKSLKSQSFLMFTLDRPLPLGQGALVSGAVGFTVAELSVRPKRPLSEDEAERCEFGPTPIEFMHSFMSLAGGGGLLKDRKTIPKIGGRTQEPVHSTRPHLKLVARSYEGVHSRRQDLMRR